MKSSFLYITDLVKYAFRKSPLLYLCLVLSIVSIGAELLAMSSLLPLMEIATNNNMQAKGFIVNALKYIDIAPTVISLLLVFFILFSIRLILQLISQGLTSYLGRMMMAQLGSSIFDEVVAKSPLKEIHRQSIGYYISLAGDETFRASNLIILLMQLITSFLLSTLYLIAIFHYSIETGFAVIIFLVISATLSLGLIRSSHLLGGKKIEQSRLANSLFLDTMNNIRAVRSLVSEDFVITKYTKQIYQYVLTLFKVDFINLSLRLFPMILLIVASTLWLVTYEKSDAYNYVFIITMIFYLVRFFPSIGQFVSVSLIIISDAKAGKNISSLVVNNDKSTKSTIPFYKEKIRSIKFVDTSFGYQPAKPIIKNFNCSFEQGKSYAIAGESGSGKSTLADLLLKFYESEKGQILINGKPNDKIQTTELRSKILLADQQVCILNDSIYNNICFGIDRNIADVKKACECACILDDITELPLGFNTLLQYQGSNFSGGQRQRIGLARALLRNPDVLVLDEITSALDSTTRDNILTNIFDAYKNKILIFITHDSQVINKVDHVINLQKQDESDASHTNSNVAVASSMA